MGCTAVLRLIGMTVEAAHAQGKWVGVCGGDSPPMRWRYQCWWGWR